MEKIMAKYIRDYIQIVVGTMITGFGIACFVTPARIASGGVNGIATIIYYTVGIDTGLTMLIISLPIFFIPIKLFKPYRGPNTFIAMKNKIGRAHV